MLIFQTYFSIPGFQHYWGRSSYFHHPGSFSTDTLVQWFSIWGNFAPQGPFVKHESKYFLIVKLQRSGRCCQHLEWVWTKMLLNALQCTRQSQQKKLSSAEAEKPYCGSNMIGKCSQDSLQLRLMPLYSHFCFILAFEDFLIFSHFNHELTRT